jgi:predicted transcriptional regulator
MVLDFAILGEMARSSRSKAPTSRWQFLTNHAYVLLAVTRQPDIRISEIADLVGITERAAHRVLMDLVRDGYVRVSKDGRRNHYKTQGDLPLRHPAYRDYAVSSLLAALGGQSKRQRNR